MGIIYLVRQRLTNRLEVLKVLRPELATRPRLKERFLREVQVAARLDHPNIVKTYTAIDRGFLGLVIEYVPGMDLDSMVRKLGPLRLEYAMAILAQTARGLGHAVSRGLVHRDIKPSNILVSKSDSGYLAKLSDFGLCKDIEFQEADGLTVEGRFLGTPEYVAPEQALDPANSTVASDIYGLGCTLYFALTGSPPYRGANTIAVLNAHINAPIPDIRQLRPDVPAQLHELIQWMLQKDPRARCQSPQQVAEQLESILSGSPLADSAPQKNSPPIPQGLSLGPEPDSSPGSALSSSTGAVPNAARIPPLRPPVPRIPPRKPLAKRKNKGGFGFSTVIQIAMPLVLLAVVLWVRPWRTLSGPGTLVISEITPGVSVEVDGQEIDVGGDRATELSIEPGKHLLRFRRNGKTITQAITIQPQGRLEVVASFQGGEDAPSPAPPPAVREPNKRDTPPPSALAGPDNNSPRNDGPPTAEPSTPLPPPAGFSRAESMRRNPTFTEPESETASKSTLPAMVDGRDHWTVVHERTIGNNGNSRLSHLTLIPRDVTLKGNEIVAALGFKVAAWDTKWGTPVPLDVPMGETKAIVVGANDKTFLYHDDYNCEVHMLQKQKPVPLFKSAFNTLVKRVFVLSADCKSLGCVDVEESFSKVNLAQRKEEPIVPSRHPVGSDEVAAVMLTNRLDAAVVIAKDGRILVWETGSGDLVAQSKTELTSPIIAAHLINQTNQVIMVTESGELEARKLPRLENIVSASLFDGMATATCAANRLAAIADHKGGVTLVDLVDMEVIERLPPKANQDVRSLALSQDGKLLAIGYGDSAIGLYSLKRNANGADVVRPIDAKRD